MQTASLTKEIIYNESKPTINVMLETDGTKEIRIAMKTGQFMKEHKTPYPIVVELFEGTLDFGVKGEILHLESGDMLALEGDVAHDLVCTNDCIVRLSLSKLDKVERVLDVIK
tara:strand:+ start:13121 stop:13459 length:339 start_codon:yes stop_codon:yes gene_type:complete